MGDLTTAAALCRVGGTTRERWFGRWRRVCLCPCWDRCPGRRRKPCRRKRGEGPVGAERDVPGPGEHEECRQRLGAGGQRGVEVEAGEVVQAVGEAATGDAHDRDGHPVRGVRDEPSAWLSRNRMLGYLRRMPLRTSRYCSGPWIGGSGQGSD